MKTSTITMLLVAMFFFYGTLPSIGQNKEWTVPSKYARLENPTEKSNENLAIGKSVYSKHCKSCHGKKGLGDGPKAAELDTSSGDFSLEAFQSQTDGELFYKSYEGRDDMPNYRKKIPNEEDMWLVVQYMRTMAAEN